MPKSSISLIFDHVNARFMKYVQDGTDSLLGVAAKIRNAAGTTVNPSTEETVTSIKDTDGIKKITDALPTGDNWVGRVKVGDGTNVADLYDDSGINRLRVEAVQKSGSLHNVVLYDSLGNPVGVVVDGAVYRLQTESKIARGASNLVTLDAVDTTTGQGRLKATLYSKDGDAISFPSLPGDAAGLQNDFVRDSGSSPDLLVDGDPTPIEFTYDADATYDISLQEIKLVFTASLMRFGSEYFGTKINGLTNGVLIQITSGGVTGTVINLKRNEDLLSFASPGGFEWIVSSNDLVSSDFVVGGAMKLHAGTGDNVKVTIRDDIDNNVGTYFQCYVKGNLLG
jgi:hypothetical protein